MEGIALKKEFKRTSRLIARAALAVTKANMNSTCIFAFHQPKMPEVAKKLRNF
jgi:cyclic lactone autoinducer peptide